MKNGYINIVTAMTLYTLQIKTDHLFTSDCAGEKPGAKIFVTTELHVYYKLILKDGFRHVSFLPFKRKMAFRMQGLLMV